MIYSLGDYRELVTDTFLLKSSATPARPVGLRASTPNPATQRYEKDSRLGIFFDLGS